jgi:alpha-L-rhamnosidase
MHVLGRIGRYDVAYRLLHNDTFPSWGFSIKHGATSIWERWNSWTPEGFGDVGMNSFSHYTYGAVGQWMFENIGVSTPKGRPLSISCCVRGPAAG